ncbi:MAG: VWA domain-containing protein [Anaerolineae bacterium]|nr:VWA domain-containing protein [Thermoflexales bacterium]MDW8406148.1 VWA domain-containing protein [Anaerolineae bacterium]
MDVLWPGFLVLLGMIPLLVGAYIWMLRRQRRLAVRYSSLSLLRTAIPRRSRWRQHVPFVLFALALTSLVMALSRPVAIASVPYGQSTIVLTIDVSRSMCSNDVEPNRLVAAQRAALSFIERQPPGTQIGIVAFAGFAEIVQPPTNNREVLRAAVEGLLVGYRTAIGSGILKAIDAIAEVDPNVAPSLSEQDLARDAPRPMPVPRGAYAPAIIVLLTDGASNTGIRPLDAARQAAERGLRVYTIGFGTERGSMSFPYCGPQLTGREPMPTGPSFFGGGMGSGTGGPGRFRRGIDEETLKQVAALTGAQYFSAESAGELQQVFESLPTHLITKYETTEISFAFAGLGALAAALAAVLSLAWRPLPQ